MYHCAYPASWLLGNHIQQKLPFLMSYGDLSVIAVDPVTAFVPYGQLSQVYASPVIFDVQSMKGIPVNLFMRNVESVNSLIPLWCRKGFSPTMPERQFSKDSLVDSGNGSDGATSSSRSSTPSSVGASPNAGPKQMSHSERVPSPVKQHRQRHSHFRYSSALTNSSISSHSKQNLHYIFHGDQWDNVSEEIWKHYVKNRQPEEVYFKKMRLRNLVHSALIPSFPNCNLCVVGSSVNGLGANASDMDMCLILTSTEIDQQTEAMLLLRCVQRILSRCSFIKTTELITAKVPILKFTDEMNIQVDLNINNTVGIANTNLIRNYCYMDWRVQPLVLVIKKWAQDCNINNAKDMTLSSYSLTLMVIHYLQWGSSPPVLPCLQKMRPKKYSIEQCLKWQDSHDDLPHFKSRNNSSLGSLLFGFFNYFSNVFDFDRDVMSIRIGGKLPKHMAMNYRSAKNKRGHWKYICIEEPFNRTNTACAVYDADSFARIFTAFQVTYMKLKENQDISAVLKL